MGTTEFVVAGLLQDIAADLGVSVAWAGLLITVFAAGMVVVAPLMTMLTRRMPQRVTLMLALAVFALGHVIVAVRSSLARERSSGGATPSGHSRSSPPRPSR